MGYYDNVEFKSLEGKILKSIDNQGDVLRFNTVNDESYRMWHKQSCCESVDIEDIAGDLDDLIGVPILLAEEVSSSDASDEVEAEREKAKATDMYYYSPDSETWTFYKLSTIKGSVTIRWYGTSNGYYSESVSFEKE